MNTKVQTKDLIKKMPQAFSSQRLTADTFVHMCLLNKIPSLVAMITDTGYQFRA